MKPCLIFDLDGTLVDSLPGIAASLNRALAAHGLPRHSQTAVRSFVGNGLRMLVERAAPEGSRPRDIEALVAAFKRDYDQTWKDGTKVYAGVHAMLAELQRAGYAMAVLSNKTHDFTVAMVQAVFPTIHFVKILGQRDGSPPKPDPSGALLLANAFGVAPAKCVIIGDSTMDLETASNADMQAIAVTWGYHDAVRLEAAGASRIVAQPEDLAPALVE